ncbi:hypothetical protein F183_A29920 [Bryobacterales bacterium F-183]|nr:hypothetical protein F183_A29920 [Bryobacterales bacterium F-183]
MGSHHLAQINIGRLLAPVDHPSIAEFTNNLDEINALAEGSKGFVWRLKSDAGNATDIAYNDDPLTIVNMSVWESIEDLHAYVYQTRHIEFFKKRANWFEKSAEATYALWWVPAGHVPTVTEGRERLEHYRQHGATEHAFWFSQRFPMPSLAGVR